MEKQKRAATLDAVVSSLPATYQDPAAKMTFAEKSMAESLNNAMPRNRQRNLCREEDIEI